MGSQWGFFSVFDFLFPCQSGTQTTRAEGMAQTHVLAGLALGVLWRDTADRKMAAREASMAARADRQMVPVIRGGPTVPE